MSAVRWVMARPLTLSAGGPEDRRSRQWSSRQPRVCPICNGLFSNKFNLKQHIVNVHTNSAGVECTLCKKVCKNKWYRRRHEVVVHGAPLKRGRLGAEIF